MGPKMTLHSLQFLNKIFFSVGKSRKFEGVGQGGKGYDPHPVEWKFPGGGGSETKVFSLWGYEYFLKLQFQQYPRESNPGRPVCKLSISSGEQNYP